MSTLQLPQLNERPDLCGPCGGRCCKRYAGAAIPEDIILEGFTLEESVIAALETGKWAIDWAGWDVNDPDGMGRTGRTRSPFMRARGTAASR